MYNTNMSRTQIIFVKNTTQNKKSMIKYSRINKLINLLK